jgi:hypothetical protein
MGRSAKNVITLAIFFVSFSGKHLDASRQWLIFSRMHLARQTHETATAFLMGIALFALAASWWLWTQHV